MRRLPPNSEQPSFRGRRKSTKWVLLISIIIILGLGGLNSLYRYHTHPERLRARVERLVAERLGVRPRIGSAAFDWSEGLSLENVRLELPISSEAGDATASFLSLEVPSLILRVTGADFLRGRTTPDAVVAREPTVTLRHSVKAGPLPWDSLRAALKSSNPSRVGGLPMIDCRDVRLRAVQVVQGQEELVVEVVLNLRGRALDGGDGLYDVIWEGGSPRLRGHARWDSASGQFSNQSGGGPWISAEALSTLVGASAVEIAAWPERLHLRGRVRITDFVASRGAGQSRAVVDWEEGSLSIPVSPEEHPLPAEQRYLRFERITARIDAKPMGLEARATGLFHGSECDIQATVSTQEGAAAALSSVSRFEASCRGIELPPQAPGLTPDQRRLMEKLRSVAVAYRDYDPWGRMDLHLVGTVPLVRPPKLRVESALIQAKGASASSRLFPYRLDDLQGDIRFDGERFTIEQLCGRHGEGRVCVNGRIEGTRRESPFSLQITGTGVPVDEELLARMPDAHRRGFEGIEVEGHVNVGVNFSRAAGSDGAIPPGRHTWDGSFDDLQVRAAEVPFDWHSIAGRLRFENDVLTLDTVRGSLWDGSLAVRGSLGLTPTGLSELDLQMRADGVTLDADLLARIPRWPRGVPSLDFRGGFELETTLRPDAKSGGWNYDAAVSLDDAAIRVEGVPGWVDRLSGGFDINPQSVHFDRIQGCLADASVQMGGTFGFLGNPSDIRLRFEGMHWQQVSDLLQTTPWAAAIEPWTVEGALAADISARSESGHFEPEGGALHIRAELDGGTLHHARLPLPLKQAEARVIIGDSGLTVERIHGMYASSPIDAECEVDWSEGRVQAVVALTAGNLSLDKPIRNLLPPGMQKTWDRLAPSGQVDLRIHRLELDNPGGASASWSLDARALLQDVGFEGGLNSHGWSGAIDARGRFIGSSGAASFSGDLNASSLEVAGIRFTDLHAPWSFERDAQGNGRLAFDSWEGRLNEGTCGGQWALVVGPDGADYSLAVVVQDAELLPLIRQLTESRETTEDHADVGGRVDARIRLSGRLGEPLSREGMGSLDIADARIYRTPLLLAIVNVIQLTIPEREAFDEVSCDFYFVGNRIELSNIALRGKSLTLAGSGSMSLPDGTVDLRLINLSSNRWPDVPLLTDLVESASSRLVELHVTGSLSHPAVRTRPLRGLTDELKSLIQRKKPKSVQPAEK